VTETERETEKGKINRSVPKNSCFHSCLRACVLACRLTAHLGQWLALVVAAPLSISEICTHTNVHTYAHRNCAALVCLDAPLYISLPYVYRCCSAVYIRHTHIYKCTHTHAPRSHCFSVPCCSATCIQYLYLYSSSIRTSDIHTYANARTHDSKSSHFTIPFNLEFCFSAHQTPLLRTYTYTSRYII